MIPDFLSAKTLGINDIKPGEAVSGDITAADTTPGSNAARLAEEMPLPRNIQTMLLLGIFLMLSFYTLYIARDVLVPIFVAIIFYLLLQPAMRFFARFQLPQPIAAFFVIFLVFGMLGGIGLSISSPATEWMAKVPQSLSRLEQRLEALKGPLGAIQSATKRVEDLTQGTQKETTVAVKGPGLSDLLLLDTRSFLSSLAITIVLLFFLLSSGDMFLRRLVEVLPKLSNKKRLVDISQEIARNIAGYLLTITAMNGAVGILTGLAAFLFGLDAPILWGVLAFLLNFLPIFGPLLGCGMLFLVGLVTFDTIWQAVMPAAAYLIIHIIEGETITPMLLARRFILNPVLVIISVVFWSWMWGVSGAFLAVPILATVKIICDRLRPLAAFGHFLGAAPRSATGLTSAL